MREQIKEIIKRIFKLSSVRDDISSKNCDKWDSLNHLYLISDMENEFDVTFTPEEMVEMTSLDIIETILTSKKSGDG
jgi:acyl carrier protein